MHRCIAILGPAIRESYRDLCIAIRIAMPQAAHRDISQHMHRDTSVDMPRCIRAKCIIKLTYAQ